MGGEVARGDEGMAQMKPSTAELFVKEYERDVSRFAGGRG
jgi:hypothetical protein